MPRLRDEVQIYDRSTERTAKGTLVALMSDVARDSIEHGWWKTPPGNLATSEPDAHWPWETLCVDCADFDYWEAIRLQSQDGQLQGAMLYQIDALSQLDSGQSAVYISRLATAPWNRPWLIANPRFSRIGTALLNRAVHHSHLLGLKGRVILSTLPEASQFYERKGFVETGVKDAEELTYLELPAVEARMILREEGLITDVTTIEQS